MLATCEVLGTVDQRPLREAFTHDVLQGLSKQPKSISSAYFYDERGSRLFEQITQLEEYYLTRCEHEILTTHASTITRALGDRPFRLIEIGAGDGHKTEILIRKFLASGLAFEYVPIDICEQSVVGLIGNLRRRLKHEGLHVRGIVAEYNDALASLSHEPATRNVVLFLGSSIGNFTTAQSLKFLRGLQRSLKTDDLLLTGFDLKKDLALLQRAYDDSAGVTREFNFNLLDRMNRELGANFHRDRFLHRAQYNVAESCMESWLVSRCEQSVDVGAVERSFHLQAWEGIRVERSHKYDRTQIESLAKLGGFHPLRHFFDHQHWFVDSLWAVNKRSTTGLKFLTD